MPVKRFIAADMRRALVMVREELGDDAMIMSTQRTKKGVELIASADEQASSEATLNIPSNTAQSLKNTVPKTPFSNTVRARDARLSPRIEPRIEPTVKPLQANQYDQASVSREPDNFGLASGKTPGQLANELELAREKMLASKRQDSMTIGEWAEQEQTKNSTHSGFEKNTTAPRACAPQSNPLLPDSPAEMTNSIEQRLDQLIEKTTVKQTTDNQKTDHDIRELQSEILSMRSLFAEQLSAMATMQQQHFNEERSHREVVPMAQVVKQRLNDLGLTQACNDAVLKSLKSLDSQTMSAEGLWKESLARLSHRIKTSDGDLVKKGGVFAFWGPTGVGKTTTIAKLAARFVIEQGTRDIVLLSTDRFRIAAHDQLKSLGQILNVKVQIIDDLNSLPAQLKKFKKESLVLIDTPGMSHQDKLLNEHLLAFRGCQGIHHILTLSANSQYQMMQACVHSYRSLNLSSCVLTKLDECASLGDGMSLLAMNKLPLSYITDGQSVPEDIATVGNCRHRW